MPRRLSMPSACASAPVGWTAGLRRVPGDYLVLDGAGKRGAQHVASAPAGHYRQGRPAAAVEPLETVENSTANSLWQPPAPRQADADLAVRTRPSGLAHLPNRRSATGLINEYHLVA